jgi:superfamily II DNA or RNA helicase
MCLAPYRLGLSATPDRPDGRHELLDHLVGPRVYERDIVSLGEGYLAEYDVEVVEVELSPDERQAYDTARGIYRDFVSRQGIRISSPGGWADFIMRSSATTEGRRAFKAWQEQRKIAFAAPSKLDCVERLLHRYRGGRTLIFTSHNDAAYTIAQRFLIPVITHQTKISERAEILDGFRAGRWRAVVTSRVLNEGVDVPEANVAIVVSGSGTVREHVQRLGRVLRRSGDKRAILFELVTAGTVETFTSERRRQHVAYGADRADQ